MNRRLVLLRHGQTEWNVTGRLQGQTDVSLDATGREQAAAVAPYVAAYAPAVLWTSDLARAAVTASYVAEQCGLESRADARFRELDLGEWSGRLKADVGRDEPHLLAALLAGDFSKIPGAEEFGSIAERFGAGLEDVVAGLDVGETAVVVAHGTAIKAGICAALGWPADAAASFAGMGNCRWAVLTEREDTGLFRLAGYDLGPGARMG